jgi:TRAP-type C4-dicarboxylate transport system substrate-binding protein
LFVYKTIKIKDIPRLLEKSIRQYAFVAYLVAIGIALLRILTLLKVPVMVADFFTNNNFTSFTFLLLLNLLLLVIGMFMDIGPAITLLAPMLVGVISGFHIDPVHFGVLMSVNLCIGFISPPFGLNLFTAAPLINVSPIQIGKKALPFIAAYLIALGLITYVPISRCSLSGYSGSDIKSAMEAAMVAKQNKMEGIEMKRKVLVALILVLMLVLSACATTKTADTATQPETATEAATTETSEDATAQDPFADGPEVTLIVSMQADDESVMDKSVEYFGQLLEERSGGKLKLDIYTTGQLGTIPEVQAGIKAGDIDMGNYSLDAGYADELAVFDLPFVYDQSEKTIALWTDSEFRDLVDAACESVGLKLLSVAPLEYRLAGSQTTIESMDDFKNWNIRVQENAIQMKLWSCLGCSPTPLAMSETYIALQQGLVNAFDNISDAHVLTKIYEQEQYIVHTNHIMFNNAMFMNLDTFNSLPEAYQQLLLDCEAEVIQYELELSSAGVQANIDYMVSQGLVDVQLSDELRAQMYEAVEPVIDDIRAQAGDAIVDAALTGMGLQ